MCCKSSRLKSLDFVGFYYTIDTVWMFKVLNSPW